MRFFRMDINRQMERVHQEICHDLAVQNLEFWNLMRGKASEKNPSPEPQKSPIPASDGSSDSGTRSGVESGTTNPDNI